VEPKAGDFEVGWSYLIRIQEGMGLLGLLLIVKHLEMALLVLVVRLF
jgi:hypothetical protein